MTATILMPNRVARHITVILAFLTILLLSISNAVGQEVRKTYLFTLQDALSALQISDALGDVKAARRLAKIARSMQQSNDQSKWVVYEITAPDGKLYQLKGPQGLTRDEVISSLQTHQADEKIARLEQKIADLRAQKVESHEPTLTEKARAKLSGVLGPSNPQECLSTHGDKVRIPDAFELLQLACTVGYSDGYAGKARDAGRCIAKSEGFYSLDQALKVVNKCSPDAATFTAYKNALYRKVDREASDRADAAEARYDLMLNEQRQLRMLIESGSLILNDLQMRQFLYGK